jgi:hypothetical protein
VRAMRDQLIDQLAEATLLAKMGLDLRGAATLHQYTTAAASVDVTDEPLTSQQAKSVAQRLTRAARTVARRVRTAPRRRVQKRGGAGRPLDAWKGALLDDVERALRAAGVQRCYYTGDEEAATVLPSVFRACAAEAGEPIPGDLRNIQRGRFRPTRLLRFSANRLSVLRLARAIWQFLPLKR